jgi:hypothetical protein
MPPANPGWFSRSLRASLFGSGARSDRLHTVPWRVFVRMQFSGKEADTGDEFDRIAAEFPLPFLVRFLMGFPPDRNIVRLDPLSS